MHFWFSDGGRLAALIIACAAIASLELLAPVFRYQEGRVRRSLPNLALAGGVVLLNLVFASCTAFLCARVTAFRVGLLSPILAQRWLALALSIMGLDLVAYVAHLLLHKLHWGWNFHRVHHSEVEVDVTTAFRQHPGETLWRQAWLWLGIVVFGPPFWMVTVYLSLSSLNAMLEHANVRMSDGIDRRLRLALVTPHMHKIHHSREVNETDSNYANIFSFWDRLFGTYTSRTDFGRLRYGLNGFDDTRTQTLAGLIREPFQNS